LRQVISLVKIRAFLFGIAFSFHRKEKGIEQQAISRLLFWPKSLTRRFLLQLRSWSRWYSTKHLKGLHPAQSTFHFPEGNIVSVL